MSTETKKKISSTRRIVSFVLAFVLITALLEIAVGNVRAFQVVSRSMEPTLKVGDCVLSVREIVSSDLRGKVVAFEPTGPGDALVKRVIARGGQTVEVSEREIFVEGAKDPYSSERLRRIFRGKWQILEDNLFVLGDNRNNSFDSIDHGPIDRDQVLGVIAFRYWPLSRIGVVH